MPLVAQPPGVEPERKTRVHRLGHRLERCCNEARLRPGRESLFAYDNAEAVWNEHRESTRGRDLDITGLSYPLLEAGAQQWPFPTGAVQGKLRLYEDGIFPTPDGKAKFADTDRKSVV